MSTTAPDSGDRYPTAGPDEATYERYRVVTTADGDTIVYDTEETDAWLQSDSTVSLENWR